MAAGEIRDNGLTAIVLPPREGFSPQAVGAIGLLVRQLAGPEDLVVGQRQSVPLFEGRRFAAVPRVIWPPFGRVERYMAGVLALLRRLRPARIEVHNRANLALAAAGACPEARVALFVHNDPQGMRRARGAAERAAILQRLQVICVSPWLARRFMEGVPAGVPSVEVLPNAIELDALPPPLPDAAREKVLLFVGRVVANKGADLFVRAFAEARPRLPDWRAVMIGDDQFSPASRDTAFLRRLRPEAAAAGVEMLGYRPHEAVLEALARAAIAVVPSRWAEPFGLAALEAMASGAALICGGGGGLPELVRDAAVIVEPAEAGALAAAMVALAENPELRARLAAAGRARALEFDADTARARLACLRAIGA